MGSVCSSTMAVYFFQCLSSVLLVAVTVTVTRASPYWTADDAMVDFYDKMGMDQEPLYEDRQPDLSSPEDIYSWLEKKVMHFQEGSDEVAIEGDRMDRNIPDGYTRCEIESDPVDMTAEYYPGYDYYPSRLINWKCVPSNNRDPLFRGSSKSRHTCLVYRQHKPCQTKEHQIPVFRRRRTMHARQDNMNWEKFTNRTQEVGCGCNIGIYYHH